MAHTFHETSAINWKEGTTDTHSSMHGLQSITLSEKKANLKRSHTIWFQLTNTVKLHSGHGELIKGHQGLRMVEGRVGVCILQVTEY